MNTSNRLNIPALVKRLIDLLRDTFSRDEYSEVILPFMLLRRLDCVLLEAGDDKFSSIIISNPSPHRFSSMLAESEHLAERLRDYMNGFGDNVCEILAHLGLMETIKRLEDTRLLPLVVRTFASIDLSPHQIPATIMGNLFEEVIRECDGVSSHPGEHFTPSDVTTLMVSLLLARGLPSSLERDEEIAIYDPSCGSGGLLFGMCSHLQQIGISRPITLWGQEVNPVSYALCKAECYLYGLDASHIALGNTLTDDRHAGKRFSLQIANPPFGHSWRNVQDEIVREAKLKDQGRFAAGFPARSDGQLLFLQHVLSHMKDADEGESRIAILLNGSANTTGDAGSGESEIRRFVFEHDWLETMVALPENLFHNTGIPTYLWMLSNRKPARRRGRVQLINAVDMWAPLRRSQGEKRRELTNDHIAQIIHLYLTW